MLWAIVAILLIMWFLGIGFHIAGSLVHILLVIALVVIVFNLLSGRRGTGIKHVIRNLYCGFFDRDQRPDLWGPHSARARAMDLRWRTRLDRSRNFDRRESNAAKRSICLNLATGRSGTKGVSNEATVLVRNRAGRTWSAIVRRSVTS